jgi:hypothetical protein
MTMTMPMQPEVSVPRPPDYIPPFVRRIPGPL